MVEVAFLAHCYEQNKHDKIWGYVKDGPAGALTFWGRRRGTLSFKRYIWERDAQVHGWDKCKRNYRKIFDPEDHYRYLPEDFEAQLMLARLGQIKFA